MRALIDTCIIIDALQSREPFKDNAEKIFLLAANNSFDGFITAKSVTDIYYITHRLTHSDQNAREILSKLFTLFSILDTTGTDCKKALLSKISDYEDAVMVATAIRSDMNCIITRNQKDYTNSLLPVYSPDEFINNFNF